MKCGLSPGDQLVRTVERALRLSLVNYIVIALKLKEPSGTVGLDLMGEDQVDGGRKQVGTSQPVIDPPRL